MDVVEQKIGGAGASSKLGIVVSAPDRGGRQILDQHKRDDDPVKNDLGGSITLHPANFSAIGKKSGHGL